MIHRGQVRGGSNSWARLHLNIKCDRDEEGALAEGLRERFLIGESSSDSIKESGGWGIYIRINTRRGFSLVPAIVRWACLAERTISIAHWDGDAQNTTKYPEAGFFKAIAEAACFYGS